MQVKYNIDFAHRDSAMDMTPGFISAIKCTATISKRYKYESNENGETFYRFGDSETW